MKTTIFCLPLAIGDSNAPTFDLRDMQQNPQARYSSCEALLLRHYITCKMPSQMDRQRRGHAESSNPSRVPKVSGSVLGCWLPRCDDRYCLRRHYRRLGRLPSSNSPTSPSSLHPPTPSAIAPGHQPPPSHHTGPTSRTPARIAVIRRTSCPRRGLRVLV